MGQIARFKRLKRLAQGPFPALTVRYARRFLADSPDQNLAGIAWLWAGIALVELHRYEEGQQAIAKAIEYCPEEKRWIPLSHMGHLFDMAGDYCQAAEWYRQAIEASPDNASNHVYLGAVLTKQGRLHDAEAAHRKAIECNEGCIDEAYFNLGIVLRGLDRYQEAADCLREALRRDPDYRQARRVLRDVERCMNWLGGRA